MASNSNVDDTAVNAAQYVEDYLDFVQNIPDDVQRNVTRLREIDLKYQEVLKELDSLWDALNKDIDSTVRKRTLLQAQRALIRAQELGDEKLQLWQNVQDIIENKSRQLDLDFKKLDLGRENEVHTENHKADVQPERASKRARRQRHVDVSLRDDGMHEKPEKELPPPTACKKQKKKKRKTKTEKEPVASPFEPPIDPDEPTYCLCDQVSFGEMICCDNQNCAREWFHFSCVGLNFKPKGKWYCPKCRGERSNQMKPQAS